ncbi:MAG TPA: hypothetical protein VN633_15585, partial [Bryobacteraceae bacterium]|nr:hypothetical protein [Bryobacteraceae bacterium]
MSEKRWDRHEKERGKHEAHRHGRNAGDRHDHIPAHNHPSFNHPNENHHLWPYGELHYAGHGSRGFDLAQAAIGELQEAGFKTEFGPGVQTQVAEIEQGIAQGQEAKSAADLHGLGWSSIDNDTSK